MESYTHCFVCLTQPILQNSNNLFRYIFHYLQMTQRRKIPRDCSIPKLLLCLDCTILIENFSVLYKQLEKVRMEMDFYLKLICDKIVRSEGKVEEPKDIERIREELLLNCSNNFRKSFPQLKLSRLKSEDIHVWRSKRTYSSNKEIVDNEINEEGSISLNAFLEAQLAPNIKVELSTEISFEDQLIPNVKEDIDPLEGDFEEPFEDEYPSEPVLLCEVENSSPIPKKKRKNENLAVEAFIISTNTDINGPSCLTCGGCGVIFSRKDLLKRHIATSHLNIKKFQCPECPNRYKRRYRMLEHFNIKHTLEGDQFKRVTRLTCNICRTIFKTTKEFRAHRVEAHNEQITFPCDLCPRVCYKEENIQNHKRLHSLGNLETTCIKCGEVFDDPLMKKQHMKDAHKILRFKCAIKGCTSIYTQKFNLIIHFKKQHKGIPLAYTRR